MNSSLAQSAGKLWCCIALQQSGAFTGLKGKPPGNWILPQGNHPGSKVLKVHMFV